MSLFGRDMEELTRDGRSSMKMRKKEKLAKDLMKTSVSTSIDHSISDLDFQCKELLSVSEPTMLSLNHGFKIESHSNSSSIMLARLSDLNNGRTMLWKSKAMEETTISE
jgi:hypothetical protein